MMAAAEWRPVAGFSSYEVSSDGRVRNASTGKVLRCAVDGLYCLVSLRREGSGHTRRVHRLVAEAFHGPAPASHEVRHLDGDGTNNVASNLLWGTHAENEHDKIALGRVGKWNSNKTHCVRGHEYTPENTHLTQTGGRVCKTCRREQKRTCAVCGAEVGTRNLARHSRIHTEGLF